jgi:hypothetical protein
MRYFLSGMLIVLSLGCGPDPRVSYQFEVRDGDSKSLLHDVSIDIYGHGHYHNNRLFPGQEEFSAGATDFHGRVVVNNLIMNTAWEYRIVLEKVGYRTLSLEGAPDEVVGWRCLYKKDDQYSQDIVSFEQKLDPAGVNVLEIYKLTSDSKPTGRHAD